MDLLLAKDIVVVENPLTYVSMNVLADECQKHNKSDKLNNNLQFD